MHIGQEAVSFRTSRMRRANGDLDSRMIPYSCIFANSSLTESRSARDIAVRLDRQVGAYRKILILTRDYDTQTCIGPSAAVPQRCLQCSALRQRARRCDIMSITKGHCVSHRKAGRFNLISCKRDRTTSIWSAKHTMYQGKRLGFLVWAKLDLTHQTSLIHGSCFAVLLI